MSHHSSSTQQQHKNMLGHTIADGRLELVSVLGLGAYGVVYLARDLTHPLHQQPYASTSSRDVPAALAASHGAAASGYYAVKCLNKVGLDHRQRTFQRREITLHTLASKHQSVVTLHRVIDSEDDPCVYVIMDYCPDGDLFSMITERQRYAVAPAPSPSDDEADEAYCQAREDMDDMVKSVFFQILDAVQFCHGFGIYHRDLKPENILCLDGGARVVLADFGLATGDKVSGDFGCGSTFYMGPECQGGIATRLNEYDTAANDVWSLGVILVNLVCGRNPWKQACTSDETFREYLRNPNFLQEILPISDETNAILKRVFTVREDWRCSLAELRTMVENVTRFTATDAEMASRQEAARIAASRARALAHAQKQAQKQAALEAALREQQQQQYLRAATTAPMDFYDDETEQYDDWSEQQHPQAATASRQPSCEVDWTQHPIAARPSPVRRALISEPSLADNCDAPSTPCARPIDTHSQRQPPLSPTSSDRSSPNSACDSDDTLDSSGGSLSSSASYTGLPPTPRFNPTEVMQPPPQCADVDMDFRLDALAIQGHGRGVAPLVADAEIPKASLTAPSPLECAGAVKIPRSPRLDCFDVGTGPQSRWARRGVVQDDDIDAISLATGLSADDSIIELQSPSLGHMAQATDVFEHFSFIAPLAASPAPSTPAHSRFATMPSKRASPNTTKHHQQHQAAVQAVKRARGQVALAFQRPHHFFGHRNVTGQHVE